MAFRQRPHAYLAGVSGGGRNYEDGIRYAGCEGYGMEQHTTAFNLAAAQAAAREDQLAAWVGTYLRTSVRPNVPFADGLQLEQRWWAGPRLLPLDHLTRTCGPEPEMPFRVPADDWERYVTMLAAGLTTPEALPPLIVLYQDGTRRISDGNNRHEAMRRRGWAACWVLLWYTSENDYLCDAEL